jgi:hypothetical protein
MYTMFLIIYISIHKMILLTNILQSKDMYFVVWSDEIWEEGYIVTFTSL